MYATPTRFAQFDTWAELEAPGIPDLPKVLKQRGYTTLSSGKIYHKRLDNEHSWDEICGFGADIPNCDYSKGMCCRMVSSGGRRASEAAAPPCKTWCAHGTKKWAEKCSWSSLCAGCGPCKTDLTARDESYLDEFDSEEAEAEFFNTSGYRNKKGYLKVVGSQLYNRGTAPATEAAAGPNDKWLYPDGRMTLKTIGDIRAAKLAGNPFFIAAGFNRPHLPFACPKEYWDLYQRSEIVLPSNPWLPEGAPTRSVNYFELRTYDNIPDYDAGQGGPNGGQVNLPEDLAKELQHGYLACVSYVDDMVGHLFDELKAQAMYDNTIITFASDHGYKLGNKGSWCKHSMYETDLHVPMIIKAPGFAPSRVSAMVENVDLYPTILDLVGIPAPPHVQGRSLVPLLVDPNALSRKAIFARYRRCHAGQSRWHSSGASRGLETPP